MSEEILWRKRRPGKYWNLFSKEKRRRIGHALRHDRLLHEITEGRMKGKPTRGRRRIQILHDLAMMVALLHSNRQLRTERYGNTEKGCQKLLFSRRLHWIEIPHYQEMIECWRWFGCNPDPWMFTWFFHCRIGPRNSCLGVGFPVSECFYLSK